MPGSRIPIQQIIRSRRKSVALAITRDASLVVRAPVGVPLAFIEEVVEKHRSWIEKKRGQILVRGIPQPKSFVEGEEFLFLGDLYPLKISDCREIEIEKGRLVFPQKFLKSPKLKLIRWYKEQAFSVITEIARRYSRLSGWQYQSIQINSAETRWGSCSSRGSLNFSWKLILAPYDAVEYVVAHELAHITEKNHSPRFWAKVRSIMPDYEARASWLKENGRQLVI